MRVSDISQWVTCEVRALSDPRPQARVSAAAVVGTMAHALLAGIEGYGLPSRVTFDNITKNMHQAQVQAEAIAADAHGRLIGSVKTDGLRLSKKRGRKGRHCRAP